MPIHEYECAGCGHEFEMLVNASSQPKCPACGSPKLAKQFSSFTAGSGASNSQSAAEAPPCERCAQAGGSCPYEP